MARSTVADLDDVTPEELLNLLGRATTGADITAEEVAAFLECGFDTPTEKRVLAYFSKVAKKVRAKAGRKEPTAEVALRRLNRGRLTTFAGECVACSKPGASWVERSKRASQLAAIAHLREHHDSVGSIVGGR